MSGKREQGFILLPASSEMSRCCLMISALISPPRRDRSCAKNALRPRGREMKGDGKVFGRDHSNAHTTQPPKQPHQIFDDFSKSSENSKKLRTL